VPLLAIRGYTAPEVEQTYERARHLATQSSVTGQREQVMALFWLTSYYAVAGRFRSALGLAKKMVKAAEMAGQDELLTVLAHVLTGLPLYFMGRLTEAKDHFALAAAAYRPKIHQRQVHLIGQDPGIAAHAWLAMIHIHQGNIIKAESFVRSALCMSTELKHPYTHAFSLLMAGISPPLFYDVLDEKTAAFVDELHHLAEEKNFYSFKLYAHFYRGFIEARRLLRGGAVYQPLPKNKINHAITQMRRSLEEERASGHMVGLSSRMILLADVYRQCGQIKRGLSLLEEVEAFVDSCDERYFEADLYRLRGELLLCRDPQDTAGMAEHAFEHALSIAQKQGARLFELKAAVRLAKLWVALGRMEQVETLLYKVCAGFPKDLSLPDLDAARCLLAHALNPQKETSLL
jgi:tetratricopeptide (TPR) repeat protein